MELRENIKVWDPMVRLFHWSLVGSFALAWLVSEGSASLHNNAGYVAAGLIGFRLVWGLIGPRYARFAQFLRGPRTTMDYIRDVLSHRERRFIGHNPAGGAMIIALLASVAGTAYTGWLMTTPGGAATASLLSPLATPAFAESGGEAGGLIGGLHSMLANLSLLLVVAHVGGVVVASLRHRENLARAMVTGRKRPAEGDDVA